MDREKTLQETVMEKFTQLDPEGKILALGFIMGYVSGKENEKKTA